MSLIDLILQNPEALRRVGETALEDARKAGAAIYYIDDAFGDDIIREFPDGRRERISRSEDGAAVPIARR